MPRTMWKNFHLCFPTNLIKPSSEAAASSQEPNRPSILFINNFNHLYEDDSIATGHRIFKPLIESNSYGFAPGDSPPPDLTAVLASRRFFFSSPSRSNSITDSPDLRPRFDYKTSTATRLLQGGAAVKQNVQSLDPYNDFRRSILQEMLAVTSYCTSC
ncbi:hypothetical protein DY000_02044474 [Brassica cretica]|uniref:Ovate family protein n=1 Tax=Brassica cretica TaxID=69181 RepID=A0ABQ7ER99_BRACR|nr:hypothetical protein DY000_02044474 [Brassica cretica]